MRFLLLVILCLSGCGALAQSKSTGIYVPIKCSRHVPSYTVQLSLKQVCLANSPLVSVKEFESVSAMVEVPTGFYFDLVFTSQGYATLVRLQNSFPYSDLALMIDGEVFIVFSMTDKRTNRTFRFQGQPKDRDLFNRALAKIQEQLAPAN